MNTMKLRSFALLGVALLTGACGVAPGAGDAALDTASPDSGGAESSVGEAGNADVVLSEVSAADAVVDAASSADAEAGTPPPDASGGDGALQYLVQLHDDAPSLALAQGLGLSLVRSTPNMVWSTVEPALGGGYRWESSTDLEAMRLAGAGLARQGIILSSRPDDPAHPAGCDPSHGFLLSPGNMAAYSRWVTAMVERYDGDGVMDMPGLTRPIHYWSYYPEVGTYWCTTGAAALMEYATMLDATVAAVHAADPSAIVTVPLVDKGIYIAAFVDGVYTPPSGTIVVNAATYDRSMAATAFAANIMFARTSLARLHADGIDLHLYGAIDATPAIATWVRRTLSASGSAEQPLYSFEGGSPYAPLDGVIAARGPDTCTGGMVTENGVRLAYQSNAMLRHVALAGASGFRTVAFNLQMEYGPTWGTDYGDLDLIDACLHPRPAYYTLQSILQNLSSASRIVEVSATSALHLYRFVRPAPAGDAFVAWGSGTPRATDLSSALGAGTIRVVSPVTLTGVSTPMSASAPTNAVPLGADAVMLLP